ncbi:MAG TPA: hypothetical protein VFH68_00115 [Polyangia bacterium]|nr:hypothetical protein [Polyangia bacterium]
MATRYKQPSSFSGVSVALLLLVALTAWGVLSAWPVIALNSGVKNELEEVIPRIYRANLRPEPACSEEIARVQEELTARLRALGVTDPKLAVEIQHNEKRLSVEARYQATATLRGTQKSRRFDLHPRVESDATRVEW